MNHAEMKKYAEEWSSRIKSDRRGDVDTAAYHHRDIISKLADMVLELLEIKAPIIKLDDETEKFLATNSYLELIKDLQKQRANLNETLIALNSRHINKLEENEKLQAQLAESQDKFIFTSHRVCALERQLASAREVIEFYGSMTPNPFAKPEVFGTKARKWLDENKEGGK